MRALFDRLPVKGYQDNVAVDAICLPFDLKLRAVADKLENLYAHLSLTHPVQTNLAVGIAYEPVTGLGNRTGVRVDVSDEREFKLRVTYSQREVNLLQVLEVFEASSGGVRSVYSYSFKGALTWTHSLKLSPGSYFISVTHKYELLSSVSVLPPVAGIGRQLVTMDDTGFITPHPYTSSLSVALPTDSELEQASYLDYIAYLVGLTGNYWMTSWDNEVKLTLLKNVADIQSYRGTLKSLLLVLAAQSLNAEVVTGNSPLVLPFQVYGNGASKLGISGSNLYLRYGSNVSRASREFIESQRAITSFVPDTCNARVCYDAFYAGLSVANDPVFDKPVINGSITD